MSRPKRYLILTLVVVVVAALVAGVAWFSVGYNPDDKPEGLYVNNKYVKDPGPILTIGSHQIMIDEYRHYYLLYQYYFENYYGIDFSNDPDGDYAYELKRAVEQELTNMYTLIDIAAEQGITLNDEDYAKINATFEEQRTTFGDDFETQLKNMFFTSEENYLDVTSKQTLAQKASDAYTELMKTQNEKRLENEADTAFKKDYISAKHILVMVDLEAENYEAAKEEALAKANDVLAEVMEAEDTDEAFDEAMHEHSEDGGLEQNPDGYTFTEGEMVTVFYETAMGLEEGEISEPVLSESTNYTGYHIIQRIPLNEDTMVENRESVVGTGISNLVNEKIAAVREGLTITHGQYYNDILPVNLR